MHTHMKISYKCQWNNCSSTFDRCSEIESHLASTHLTSDESHCQWFGCDSDSKESVRSAHILRRHLRKHITFEAFCAKTEYLLEKLGLVELNNICSLSPVSIEDILDCQQIPDEIVKDVKSSSVVNSEISSHSPTYQLLEEILYACRSCRRIFQDESLLLKHLIASANKVPPDESLRLDKLHCRWFGCNQSFSSYVRLHAHVMTHHDRTDRLPLCLWRHCENRRALWAGTSEMKRHLLMHVFIEYYLQRTKQALKKRATNDSLVCLGIEYQKLSSMSRTANFLLWQPDLLQLGFYCCWRTCDFRTDSAILFAEHVVVHADVDSTLPKTSGCQWNIKSSPTELCELFEPCNIVVADIRQRRSHLYRHTGLPKFICEACQVCFIEMPTFKEHFRWSIPRQTERITTSGDTLSEIDQPIIPSLSLCPHCAKQFVTRHALSSHTRTCRMKTNGGSDPSVCELDADRSPSVRGHKRVSHSNALAVKAGSVLEQGQKLFLCKVAGCGFQSSLYSAYRFHFKRYHSSINPDGLWYACHLCTNYRARKSTTMTKHFRSVHHLKPPKGHSRFVYSEDPVDGIYRLIWRSLCPKPTVKRPILPRASISGSKNSS